MSKRRRKQREAAAAVTVSPLHGTGERASFDYAGAVGSGLSVGNDSSRGAVVFPYAKSKDHLKGFNLREARRISQWATWKVGAARKATRALAQKVGVITLAAATTDERFNAEHAEWWESMYARTPGNFEASGKFTAGEFQTNALFCCFRDGDVALVHGVADDGAPVAMTIEAALLNGGEGEGWMDGVKVGKHHQHEAYAIAPELGRDPVILPARDVMLLANYETHASVRGTPALFATLDRVRDVREVDNAAVKAAKVQALVAFYVARAMGAKEDSIPGFTGKVRFDNLAGSGTQTTAHYGAPSNIPRRINEVFDDAEMVDLPAGHELKVLNDGRDYSAQTPLKEDIYRQIAWGVGLDEHILFGMKGLTGPEVRKVLADFQEWRYHWLDAQLKFLAVDYVRKTEWAISTRQIRRPADARWWKFSVNYPKSATIDAGRDANAQEKRLTNGLTTLAQEWGEQGDGWKPNVDQWLAEKAYIQQRAAELGIPIEAVMPSVRPMGATGEPSANFERLAGEVAELRALIEERLRV